MVAQASPCWLSPRTHRYGYVYRQIGGRRVAGHRFVWEWCHGPIPPGFDVHHLCERKSCIEPSHLVLIPHGAHTALHNPGKSHGGPARAARQLAKTHCLRGHPLSGENVRVYRTRKGTLMRQCRACTNLRKRLRRRG